jgi:ABC-type molybdenum transport system ATPase subunit/photorepair protein PhrA
VARPPDDDALSLASRTRLREKVVKSASKFDPSRDASLSFALLTFDNAARVVRARSLTVRTRNLLLNHHFHGLPQVEVAQVEEQLYLQLGTLQQVEVVLVVHHRVAHFLFANAVIQKLFIAVVQHFIR